MAAIEDVLVVLILLTIWAAVMRLLFSKDFFGKIIRKLTNKQDGK